VSRINRRDFISLLGGAAAWPIAARAQKAMPLIGVLDGIPLGNSEPQLARIRQGLRQTGFIEGQSVNIQYRSAEGHYERLPALAAELVARQVDVILAVGSTNSPQAAKAATSTIPIVFAVGTDPVSSGLVSNLRRPEANLTGVTYNITALTPKRLEVARELLPAAQSIGYLRNPANRFDTDIADLEAAAQTLGFRLRLFNATTDRELLEAFQAIAQEHLPVLVVSTDATLGVHRNQIAALAAHHRIPAIYANREAVVAGGLISYGVDITPLHRQAGIYTGRILKGDKPGDLPIVLPSKFELVINDKSAKELGIEVPLSMLMRIDEVIE
jgi:putative ABC transport system substrate-binding protein